jgi:hypothetical protein
MLHACQTLLQDLDALHLRLVALQVIVSEDRPHQTISVQQMADALDDLRGQLGEAVSAAREAQRLAADDLGLREASASLVACHRACNAVAHGFYAGLFHPERMAELRWAGQAKGGAWRAWAESVSQGLEGCRTLLEDIGESLVLCWHELVDRVWVTSG